MTKRKVPVSIAAAVAITAAPFAAISATERASAPVSAESQLGGEGGLAFVAIGILAAFVAITVINSDDEPVSA